MTTAPTPPAGDSSTPAGGTTPEPETLEAATERLAELTKAEQRAAERAQAVKDGAKDMPEDGRVAELDEDAPVYDERGNVRPRGTAGAKPMTFEQRAALAREQDRGGEVPPDGEPTVRKAVKAQVKAERKGAAGNRRRR